ncbi:MAG TPA: zf-HC2 domain-containing protein [Ilumatobacteraceae bacterium]|nr:zf-HC2 domain-containing protein [Ilumatobacteraceae bacterium]
MLQPEVRCIEFVEEVTEWMEGGLTDDERLLLEEHLSICPHCTRYLDQLRTALTLLHDADETLSEPPPASARDELMAAFREMRAG